ncbi:Rhs element protein [Shigella sonnei]|nr:type VI secretion system tip protein TssI/VgrG [Shigella sonnei]CTB68997.1 Rhs element protein [Shigella sonnei]
MGGGKPAARQGDMTRKGLDIVQGSAGVLIGAPTGVACSVCPGGITYANPVNPVLGAKVLPGETDLALPCPLPFILFRAYSSYRTRTPAPVGVFGPGWKAPFDIRLQIRDEGLILNDSGGRSIHFEPLFPGEISYSRSESLWLARGGVPGRRIVLTGHPQANLNREWQVVASDLHGEQPQAVPGRRGSGTTLENHFAVIPADRTWRPQPLMKPLVDGPQSAVVTGPAGEEIFCDEHGRVRVKFNWDRYNPSNQDSSCWIRVAQAWAGTGFGNLAIPRVGQEVIVDFLNGDPDQPIIMGRTYHQENRTPGSLPGTKTQMTIRSKTYKGSGFNELKFDDATGKEQVYIHAQKNMNTEVLNNRTTDVINNHAETIGNNQMIAVTNNQIETVGVNQIETVGSNQIIKVGSVQVETIGLVRALTVGVAYQTTVGGIMNTSVALMQSSQIGLHKSLRVGLGYDVKVGNNVTFTVGKTKKDDTGQTAIYSAGEHLELCCGKARLVLTKDGQIFLNGTKIHLQGKEQVNGDSLLINWNCAASKSPPKTPDEKQDTPDMREY